MQGEIKNGNVRVNSQIVSYNEKGPESAPAIIFIHGFPLNKSMWNLQLNVLGDNYRAIAYDIRGHGNSGAGEDDFSIELFVSDLLGFMDVLEIDKAMLCGLSMGGYIALNAVENFPERFNALVLCDTQCFSDTPEGKERRLTTIENIRKEGVERFAEENLKSLFAPESFNTRGVEIAEVREMILNTSIQSLSGTLLALSMRNETCSKLAGIGIPVLIMVGQDDKITPPEAARFMHDQIKGSSLGIIPKAGHLSNLENPEQFTKELKQFAASANSSVSTSL